MQTTLLIPTLNEIDGVKATLPRIDRGWVDEIIVVDGRSTDGTVEYCKENGYSVYTQKGKGYGAALSEAIQVAQGSIIVDFYPDGNAVPEQIPELIAKVREGYDLVVGSRYKDGAVSEDDDLLTRVGNWFFTSLVNLLFRASYTDTLVGFRAYRKQSLQTLDLDARGLDWPCQSSIRFLRQGFKVTEIPASEPKRIGGTRKMKPFRTGWQLLRMILRERLRSA